VARSITVATQFQSDLELLLGPEVAGRYHA
jgi:hypothetical protein